MDDEYGDQNSILIIYLLFKVVGHSFRSTRRWVIFGFWVVVYIDLLPIFVLVCEQQCMGHQFAL